MAKIIERTPEQVEQDRRLAARSIELQIQRGIVRYRPGMNAEMVQIPKRPGAFDPEAAARAPKMAPGKKTNDPSRICPKGQGGTKGGKGATNPKVIARNERRAKRHRR